MNLHPSTLFLTSF